MIFRQYNNNQTKDVFQVISRNVRNNVSVNLEFSNDSMPYRKTVKLTNSNQSCCSFQQVRAVLTSTLIQKRMLLFEKVDEQDNLN